MKKIMNTKLTYNESIDKSYFPANLKEIFLSPPRFLDDLEQNLVCTFNGKDMVEDTYKTLEFKKDIIQSTPGLVLVNSELYKFNFDKSTYEICKTENKTSTNEVTKNIGYFRLSSNKARTQFIQKYAKQVLEDENALESNFYLVSKKAGGKQAFRFFNLEDLIKMDSIKLN